MTDHDLNHPLQAQTTDPKLNRHQRRALRHNKPADITNPLINVAFMRGTLVREIISNGAVSSYDYDKPRIIDERPMAQLKRIRKAMELKRAALHW